MQIIRDIEQGSEDWLKLRLGVATASNFKNIITPLGKETKGQSGGKSPLEKYAKKLALELFYDKLKESEYKSPAMEAGNLYEPEARQAYCEAKFLADGEDIEQIAMFKSDCAYFAYSPDGLVGNEGLIEIKNLEAEAHSEVLLNKKVPNEHIPQMQAGMWISGRKWCDFIAYNRYCKDESRKLIIIRVERDEVYIAELAKLAQKTITMRDEILKQIKGSI
jgi:hypothetical protein